MLFAEKEEPSQSPSAESPGRRRGRQKEKAQHVVPPTVAPKVSSTPNPRRQPEKEQSETDTRARYYFILFLLFRFSVIVHGISRFKNVKGLGPRHGRMMHQQEKGEHCGIFGLVLAFF